MKTRSLLIVLLSLCACTSSVLAKTPNNLDAIQREARIVADVMKSSLRNELHDQIRIASVSAEYLPNQGVLVSVRTNAPWLTIENGEKSIEINGNLALHEIPAMVENILADLQIDLHTAEPEAIAELRTLRSEQRDLRMEQRDIRAGLRSQRRELVRAESKSDKKDVQEEIDDLERELAGLNAQYEALDQDIETQYETLKSVRGGSTAPPTPKDFDNDWDQLVAQHACDYGATLKSLSSDHYLTVAVRGSENTRYFSYRMNDVKECSNGDMRSARLAEKALAYND